jgi:hypothetical protein
MSGTLLGSRHHMKKRMRRCGCSSSPKKDLGGGVTSTHGGFGDGEAGPVTLRAAPHPEILLDLRTKKVGR